MAAPDRGLIRTIIVLMVLTTFLALRAATAMAFDGPRCDISCEEGIQGSR